MASLRRVVSTRCSCSSGLRTAMPFRMSSDRAAVAPDTGLPITVGMSASIHRTFSAEDVRAFVALCGDTNPIHADRQAAVHAGFSDVVVPGALLCSLFSTLLGVHIPGPGSVYASQASKFRHPVLVGQPVTATVEVTRLVARRRRPAGTPSPETGLASGSSSDANAKVLLAGPEAGGAFVSLASTVVLDADAKEGRPEAVVCVTGEAVGLTHRPCWADTFRALHDRDRAARGQPAT
eukprot:TRINITY_DN1181_c0_g3_i1.p1 TRINITY_DN1181_c0_g3~~TRINITY_DN1181_c0_g3_i1.p1  ORF type:complete len:236 (+),score=18.82 TRINITY_DN1181_c0_g3_i1:376-1083(+)